MKKDALFLGIGIFLGVASFLLTAHFCGAARANVMPGGGFVAALIVGLAGRAWLPCVVGALIGFLLLAR